MRKKQNVLQKQISSVKPSFTYRMQDLSNTNQLIKTSENWKYLLALGELCDTKNTSQLIHISIALS